MIVKKYEMCVQLGWGSWAGAVGLRQLGWGSWAGAAIANLSNKLTNQAPGLKNNMIWTRNFYTTQLTRRRNPNHHKPPRSTTKGHKQRKFTKDAMKSMKPVCKMSR